MKNIQCKVEDIFTDVNSKDSISTEQITELKNFFSKNNVNINININFKFFKPRIEKVKIMNPLHLLNIIFSLKIIRAWCVRGKHYSNTDNIIEYEKVNPRSKELVEIIKGTCSVCSRNKSKIFTK